MRKNEFLFSGLRATSNTKESNSATKFSDGKTLPEFVLSIDSETRDIKDLTKSLILAQDERWRRA